MGKKSRAKRHHKEWIRKKPDEVVSYGSLRIERYGKFVQFVNDSTPEEQAAFLERSKEANKKIFQELEKDVPALQKLLKKYDPVEVMHMAVYVLLPLLIKYKSESEYEHEEVNVLPTLEYLQYLIARTEMNTEGKKPAEQEWKELWEQAVKVVKDTQAYLMSRVPPTNPPTEMEMLRFILDEQRLLVRVQRYPIFFADSLKTSLAPYEQQIKEIYGLDVETIIGELGKINEYQKTGIINKHFAFRNSFKTLTAKLIEKGYNPDPNAPPEEIAKTKKAMVSKEFKDLYDETQKKLHDAFTSVLFDITDITSLPKNFLSLLSVKPGESILTTLTGANHDDLSPLSPSILHDKPFLEVKDKFYYFYHTGFEDKIADIIEGDLFEKRPNQLPEMAKKRSDRVETDTKDLFTSIIQPDLVFQNVYYPNPENGDLTELDVIIGADDILFLIEIKAGSLSEGASRGATKSIRKDLLELIIEGQHQSERAEKYIKSKDEVSFFDETGKQEIFKIKHTNFRKIFRVVVTKEDLGWIGARIATLSVLDPNLSKSFPWHISVDDLRVIAELFKNDEIRFVHYLELRLRAAEETALFQHDEIEHVSLYNKKNYYHELPTKDVQHLTYDPSHMRDIDYYFMGKITGESLEVPTQKMPAKMKEFILALKNSHLLGRFEFGSIILSMNEDSRHNFENILTNLDSGREQEKQRTFRIPFPERGFGVSVTTVDDTLWEDELKKSAVQMEKGQCGKWLVVQMADKSPYEVSKIEVITPGRFTDDELVKERLLHELNTRETIAKKKPGRNDPCYCGSGKKYKKCHLE
jgi:hypothetical protein